jgi:hypothetical protein
MTVIPLAVLMAYGDGFWMISLRGAAGAIERTQGPFESWLRESTLALPLFVLAVLGALTLAMRWFGPALRRARAVVATALVVVGAGTVVGIVILVASSAYDYHLQSAQLKLVESMGHLCAGGDCLSQQLQASLGLQVHSVAYGSAMLLVTNLVLVGWAVALRGGRLAVSTTRGEGSKVGRAPASAHLRSLIVVAVVAAAAIGLAGSGLAWFDVRGDVGDAVGGAPAPSSHHGATP